jgi:hypothetical protein
MEKNGEKKTMNFEIKKKKKSHSMTVHVFKIKKKISLRI